MSEKKNRRAITAAGDAVLDIDWFFREQSISDFGIDAEIEKFYYDPGDIGHNHERASGKLLALQIKGGSSYFDERSPNGWWFRFGAKKFRYWRDHALPVVVVLVDLDNQARYWQEISPRTAVPAGKGFKVEVPVSQRVEDADAAWLELASGIERVAEAQFGYAVTVLPPSVRPFLSERSADEHPDAALVAMHLAEGRSNPGGTVRALLNARPAWLLRAGRWGFGAVGNYAHSHGLFREAAAAYEAGFAFAKTNERIELLVAAAINIHPDKPGKARRLMSDADAAAAADGSHAALRAAGRSILDRPSRRDQPWVLDPLLLTDSDDVATSAPAQRVLAMALEHGGNLDGAIRHAELALELERDSPETMETLARLFVRRWTLPNSPNSDLRACVRQLRAVIDARTPWAGPMLTTRRELARILMLAGRFEEVIELALPLPHGRADAAQLDPICVRTAAEAAALLGRADVVDAAFSYLGDRPADRLLRAHLGRLELARQDLHWLQIKVVDKALKKRDFDEAVMVTMRLLNDGVDVRDRIADLVERGVIGPEMPELADAVLEAFTDLDSAIVQLRELSKATTTAGQQYLMLLSRAGRHAEAAEAARHLYEISGSKEYLLERANSLLDAIYKPDKSDASAQAEGDPAEVIAHDPDLDAEAVAACRAALVGDWLRPTQQGRLLMFLSGTAADSGDWTRAEEHMRAAVELFDRPAPRLVWRNVECLLRLGRLPQAARLIAKHRPVVNDALEAELWLNAHMMVKWTATMAVEAWALAERFPDPRIVNSVVHQIVTGTHGIDDGEGTQSRRTGSSDTDEADQVEQVEQAELERRRALAQEPVPVELHRRAFELVNDIVQQHGDASGARLIEGADPDELIQRIIEELQTRSEFDAAIEEAARACLRGAMPYGMIAGLLGRGYATLVLQRGLGVLPAGSPDDEEHDADVADARSALGSSVALDAAAAVTLSGLEDRAALTGRFVAIAVPPATMHDLNRVSFDVRGLAGSPGSMRWDPDRGVVITTTLTEIEYNRLYERAQALQEMAERLAVQTPPASSTLFSELDERPQHAAWVDVLELAKSRDVTVYSDDLSLRRLARSEGLAAFGTPALIDALRDEVLDSASDTADDPVCSSDVGVALETHRARNHALLHDFVVDLFVTPDELLALAESENWEPGVAAATLSRPKWWLDHRSLTAIDTIVRHAREKAPKHVPIWQAVAMRGAASAVEPNAAVGVLALFAVRGLSGSPTDEERAHGLLRARGVAADLDLPDPAAAVPAVVERMRKQGLFIEDEDVAQRMVSLADELMRVFQEPTVASGDAELVRSQHPGDSGEG